MGGPGSGLITKKEQYDRRILAARLHLGIFIETILYPANPEAVAKGWKLGKVHIKEWSRQVKKKRFRTLAPRDHLKSFFFVEAHSLQEAWNETVNEILILGLNDPKAYERLEHIKRFILQTPELVHLYNSNKWAIQEIVLSNNVKICAQGYNSGLIGGHPGLILLDDVIDMKVFYSESVNEKSIERFYAQVIPMATAETRIGMSGTIQAKNDLYHSLDPETWDLHTYSAIVDREKQQTLWPEYWNWEPLMDRKKEIEFKFGPRFWLKEYENNSSGLEGRIFKEQWFKYVPRNELPRFCAMVNGWDLAVKKTQTSKKTAGVGLGVSVDNKIYIVDADQGLWDMDERFAKIEQMQIMTAAREVGIEDNVFQDDTVTNMRKRLPVPVNGFTTIENKIVKAEANGLFFMPEHDTMRVVCEGFTKDGLPILKQGIRELLDEMLACPGAEWDILDAFDIAMRAALKYTNMQQRAELMKELRESRGKSYFEQRSF